MNKIKTITLETDCSSLSALFLDLKYIGYMAIGTHAHTLNIFLATLQITIHTFKKLQDHLFLLFYLHIYLTRVWGMMKQLMSANVRRKDSQCHIREPDFL